MASTNFLQWNPTAANQESDSAYLGDSQRSGGAPTGVEFPSATANKLFYQISTFITALANSLVNKGYSPMDSNISSLQSVLANIVTFADLKPNLTAVSFSTNPQFNAQYTNGFELDLAGNVTGSTLINYSVGQILTFVITQGSVGYSFVPPSNITGWIPINMNPGTSTVQQFIVQENTAIVPLSTEINLILAQLASLNAPGTMSVVTGSRSFGTTYTNTSSSAKMVSVILGRNSGSSGDTRLDGTVQGQIVSSNTVSTTLTGGTNGITFIVPSGATYSASATGVGGSPSFFLQQWTEWSLSVF